MSDLNAQLGDLTAPTDLATRVAALEDLVLILVSATSPDAVVWNSRPTVDDAAARVRELSGRTEP